MAERSVGVGVREFVESLGSTSPTPAGGAAAALSVAHGIALLIKAGEITSPAGEITDWRAVATRLRTLAMLAIEAMDADCASFNRLLDTKRHGDNVAVNAAWAQATQRPLEVVGLASEALAAFAPFRCRIKRALTLDADAGLRLIRAGISISFANARGNMQSLREPERSRCQTVLDERIREARRSLSPFEARISEDLLHPSQA